MLRIFQQSFEEIFRKFRGNKIYKNLRSIEKILRKFVRNIG